MPKSKYTRKRAIMPFEKCAKIINNTPHDFKIRYMTQKHKPNVNRIFKTTKTTHTFSLLFGGWKTETTDFYETSHCDKDHFITEPFRHQKNKKILLSSRKDNVRVEILNGHDICFREAMLEVGDTWTIEEVVEEKLQRQNATSIENRDEI
jgi:hypothetical protein